MSSVFLLQQCYVLHNSSGSTTQSQCCCWAVPWDFCNIESCVSAGQHWWVLSSRFPFYAMCYSTVVAVAGLASWGKSNILFYAVLLLYSADRSLLQLHWLPLRVLSVYSSYCFVLDFIFRAIFSRLTIVYTVTDGKVVSGLVASVLL